MLEHSGSAVSLSYAFKDFKSNIRYKIFELFQYSFVEIYIHNVVA